MGTSLTVDGGEMGGIATQNVGSAIPIRNDEASLA